MIPELNIQKHGFELPQAALPAANYALCVRHGNVIYVSGQTPRDSSGLRFVGIVGLDITEEAACDAAKLCALRILAVVKAKVINLCHVQGVLKLNVFIRCTPDFVDHRSVADAASELLQVAFGESGIHARTTVGVSTLPGGACVELDAIFGIFDAAL